MTRRTLTDPATQTSYRGQDWRDLAACRDADPEWWFPSVGTGNGRAPDRRYKAAARDALEVCASCPVAAQCLTDALVAEGKAAFRYGVFGGLTPAERAAIAKGDAS